MVPTRESSRTFAIAALIALVGACAPAAVVTTPAPVPAPVPSVGLPDVPSMRGPLAIAVAYPKPGSPLPRVDSTFIFGTVGTGEASLRINGATVPVAANGAFLAFLPLPTDGVWKLDASVGRQNVTGSVAYRMPAPPPPPPPAGTPPPAPRPPVVTLAFPEPLIGIVGGTGIADTLATGSDVAPAYPVPTTGADRKWLFPAGTRLELVARRGEMVEARLDPTRSAWVEESLVTLAGDAPFPAPPGPLSIAPAQEWVDVRAPVHGAPFLVTSDGPTLSVALYDLPRPLAIPTLAPDRLLAGASWTTDSIGGTVLELQLTRPVWGYKAFYEADGTLVLRLRRPPEIDPRRPLRGIRIAIDAGHPPGGAIGPTGLTEAEANFAIATRLIAKLSAAGAVVIPIRSTLAPLVSSTSTGAELGARVDSAVAANADIFVSVHNNAFGEGTNPFKNEGTSTLYFHNHSRDLAEALDREIVRTTRIPDLGAYFQNIAIGRVTWMPSVITESLFMMFPQQEAALRDPATLDRLAEAHLRGIESFLRGRAAAAR